MPDKHLFEYAVIRIVPRVEREEFINAGVVLYCKGFRFLDCRFILKKDSLTALCTTLDCTELENYLHSFEKICAGDKTGGPIALLDAASRFRWLTATRSTVLQTSKVHPGFCANATEMLEQLFEKYVL